MEENFTEAALRHWRDAQLLENKECIENADHLYGFAAECAIKKVLAFLPAFSQDGTLKEEFKAHIDVLWGRVGHQSLQKNNPNLAAVLKTANPFSGWSVKQRYFANGSISKEEVEKHREAAKRLLGTAQLLGARHK